MWKLLKYDVIRNKRYIQILMGILMLFIIIDICIIFSKQATNIASTCIYMSLMLIETFGFIGLFPRIYENRFIKDDIIQYTSLSAYTCIFEPILFMVLYMAQWLFLLLMLHYLNEQAVVADVNWSIWFSPLLTLVFTGYFLLYWIVVKAIGWSKQHAFFPWLVSWSIVFIGLPEVLSTMLEPGIGFAVTMGTMGVLAILLAMAIYLYKEV